MVLKEIRPPEGVLPGEWDPPALRLDAAAKKPYCQELSPGIFVADDVLTPNDCQLLIDAMLASGQADPVSVQGRKDIPDDRIGSVRATAWSPELGAQLWQKIRAIVPPTLSVHNTTSTDWFAPTAHNHWSVHGVSPVLRFMRYEAGGQHYAHYDAGYDYGDGRRSLMSVVFYLTSVEPKTGGAIRFIEDNQSHLPTWQRDHEDWPRETEAHEVRVAISPRAGRVVFFHHRLCHDVELYEGSLPRIIIRGDIVYRALDEPREL